MNANAVTDYKFTNNGGTTDPVILKLYTTGSGWAESWRASPSTFTVVTPAAFQKVVNISPELIVTNSTGIGEAAITLKAPADHNAQVNFQSLTANLWSLVGDINSSGGQGQFRLWNATAGTSAFAFDPDNTLNLFGPLVQSTTTGTLNKFVTTSDAVQTVFQTGNGTATSPFNWLEFRHKVLGSGNTHPTNDWLVGMQGSSTDFSFQYSPASPDFFLNPDPALVLTGSGALTHLLTVKDNSGNANVPMLQVIDSFDVVKAKIDNEGDALLGSVTATSTSGIGVVGTSTTNYGVVGQSTSSYGVFGTSSTNYGVIGLSTSGPALLGQSTSNSSGLYQAGGAGNTAPTLLIKDAGQAANSVMLAVKNTAGTTTVASIDNDGDVVANTVTASPSSSTFAGNVIGASSGSSNAPTIVSATYTGTAAGIGVLGSLSNVSITGQGLAIRGFANCLDCLAGKFTQSNSNTSTIAAALYAESVKNPSGWFKASSTGNTDPTVYIQDNSQAANTLMLNISDTSGNVKASIDKEGDAILNSIVASGMVDANEMTVSPPLGSEAAITLKVASDNNNSQVNFGRDNLGTFTNYWSLVSDDIDGEQGEFRLWNAALSDNAFAVSGNNTITLGGALNGNALNGTTLDLSSDISARKINILSDGTTAADINIVDGTQTISNNSSSGTLLRLDKQNASNSSAVLNIINTVGTAVTLSSSSGNGINLTKSGASGYGITSTCNGGNDCVALIAQATGGTATSYAVTAAASSAPSLFARSATSTNTTPTIVIQDSASAQAANSLMLAIRDTAGTTTTASIDKEGDAVVNDLISTGQVVSQKHTVTFSATPTFNFANANMQEITLTANVTSSTFSNGVAGALYVLIVKQDATGSRTVAWPAAVKWSGGTVPTSSGANKVDVYRFYYDGTNYYGASNMNY